MVNKQNLIKGLGLKYTSLGVGLIPPLMINNRKQGFNPNINMNL